jgi:hypothetical protein
MSSSRSSFPSNASDTIIVEFPDVACQGAISSIKKDDMQSARQEYEALCGPATTSFKALSGTGTITGVGFFDEIHGQTGVAPNGIELHPVLAFSRIRRALSRPGSLRMRAPESR